MLWFFDQYFCSISLWKLLYCSFSRHRQLNSILEQCTILEHFLRISGIRWHSNDKNLQHIFFRWSILKMIISFWWNKLNIGKTNSAVHNNRGLSVCFDWSIHRLDAIIVVVCWLDFECQMFLCGVDELVGRRASRSW